MLPKSLYTCLISLFGLCLASQVLADDFQQVKQLLKQNNPQQAYQILNTKEESHIGEPEYDILLARSALAAGHPNEAIFAFERVLMTTPTNQIARVELAVAYYQINELERAKQLFAQAQGAKPPQPLKETIEQYLLRINEKIGSRRHKFNGELSLKQGWDNNINSATNAEEVDLIIGTYRPTAGVDKQTSDSFTEVINRLNYNYGFNINSEFFSSLGYSNRDNNSKQFDTQSADVKIGYSHTTEIGRISIPLTYQAMWLDEKQLRTVTTLATNLNRSGHGAFIEYGLQYGEIRYPYQHPLDVDFVAASIALGSNDNQSVFNPQWAVFYGDETATRDLYAYNAREYMGMQIRLPMRLAQTHYLTPSLVYQQADYKQQHPFFNDNRSDRYTSAELNWRWYFSRQWSVTGQLSHVDSHSTVALYTYKKDVYYAGINYLY